MPASKIPDTCAKLSAQLLEGLAPHDRDEILAAHPEWFALYGGKRHNQPGQQVNQLCYSNDELFQETLRYVRALMDCLGCAVGDMSEHDMLQ